MEKKNIILISIDTLKADEVGCINPDSSLTPNIDRMAGNGYCHKNCFSQGPNTPSSFSALMTSTYPLMFGDYRTEGIRKRLPELYSQSEKEAKDIKVIVKYFTPDSSWTWYAYEFDGKDTFFGYVKGIENEYGYFSLSELENVKGPYGLSIERDLYFPKDATMQQVLDGDVS